MSSDFNCNVGFAVEEIFELGHIEIRSTTHLTQFAFSPNCLKPLIFATFFLVCDTRRIMVSI